MTAYIFQLIVFYKFSVERVVTSDVTVTVSSLSLSLLSGAQQSPVSPFLNISQQGSVSARLSNSVNMARMGTHLDIIHFSNGLNTVS